MRHGVKGRQLSRNSSHRLALFRNLSRSLITHESIKTTTPKARELRPFIEKLITLAKNAHLVMVEAEKATEPAEKAKLKAKALHLRRQAVSKLGPTHGTGIYTKDNELVSDANNTVLKKLFNVIGPRYATRPGGYTRILKLHTRRLGDAGEQAIIELMKEGETKIRFREKKGATAPAPLAPQ
ncbi:MAG: 50S ribosomal protein L17 [Gemmataceae bacterium]